MSATVDETVNWAEQFPEDNRGFNVRAVGRGLVGTAKGAVEGVKAAHSVLASGFKKVGNVVGAGAQRVRNFAAPIVDGAAAGAQRVKNFAAPIVNKVGQFIAAVRGPLPLSSAEISEVKTLQAQLMHDMMWDDAPRFVNPSRNKWDRVIELRDRAHDNNQLDYIPDFPGSRNMTEQGHAIHRTLGGVRRSRKNNRNRKNKSLRSRN